MTSLADPLAGVARGAGAGRAAAEVPVRRASYGETGAVGPLQLAGARARRTPPSADSDSPPNDASIVLLVQTRAASGSC